MSEQRRHEAPEVGDAIVRMMRGLVERAAEGDWEALEQLQRVDGMSSTALNVGVALAPYSLGELAPVLGVTRGRIQQRRQRGLLSIAARGVAHVLLPGHTKRGCEECRAL